MAFGEAVPNQQAGAKPFRVIFRNENGKQTGETHEVDSASERERRTLGTFVPVYVRQASKGMRERGKSNGISNLCFGVSAAMALYRKCASAGRERFIGTVYVFTQRDWTIWHFWKAALGFESADPGKDPPGPT